MVLELSSLLEESSYKNLRADGWEEKMNGSRKRRKTIVHHYLTWCVLLVST
jgi:hypothetical protein